MAVIKQTVLQKLTEAKPGTKKYKTAEQEYIKQLSAVAKELYRQTGGNLSNKVKGTNNIGRFQDVINTFEAKMSNYTSDLAKSVKTFSAFEKKVKEGKIANMHKEEVEKNFGDVRTAYIAYWLNQMIYAENLAIDKFSKNIELIGDGVKRIDGKQYIVPSGVNDKYKKIDIENIPGNPKLPQDLLVEIIEKANIARKSDLSYFAVPSSSKVTSILKSVNEEAAYSRAAFDGKLNDLRLRNLLVGLKHTGHNDALAALTIAMNSSEGIAAVLDLWKKHPDDFVFAFNNSDMTENSGDDSTIIKMLSTKLGWRNLSKSKQLERFGEELVISYPDAF